MKRVARMWTILAAMLLSLVVLFAAICVFALAMQILRWGATGLFEPMAGLVGPIVGCLIVFAITTAFVAGFGSTAGDDQ